MPKKKIESQPLSDDEFNTLVNLYERLKSYVFDLPIKSDYRFYPEAIVGIDSEGVWLGGLERQQYEEGYYLRDELVPLDYILDPALGLQVKADKLAREERERIKAREVQEREQYNKLKEKFG